jgi:hypothetical protein
MRIAQTRCREPDDRSSQRPEEDAMKPTPHAPAARTQAKRATEVYCRRDNRVYAVCPHVAAGSRCRCLSEVETADALFESDGTDPTTGS